MCIRDRTEAERRPYAIHQSGKWYTNENIDQMLMERHLNKKARRAFGKNHLKGQMCIRDRSKTAPSGIESDTALCRRKDGRCV